MTAAPRVGRSLVSDELFAKLARRVADEEHVPAELAARIVDQALVFLGACAAKPGLRLSPSRTVDAGWHAFILHTREYAAFCERIAGHFIHHEPNDGPTAGPDCGQCHEEGNCAATGRKGNENRENIVDPEDAVNAIIAAEYVVDHELWAIQGE